MDSISLPPEPNQFGFFGPYPERRALLPPNWMSSPYILSIKEFIEKLGTTEHRCTLLNGFLNFRQELRALGFFRGHHWIGGSFVEDLERRTCREPKDLDIASFLFNPIEVQGEIELIPFLYKHSDTLDRKRIKSTHGCDSFLFPMEAGGLSHNPESALLRVIQWILLYGSHPSTRNAKGFIQVDFETLDDDFAAREILASCRPAAIL